MYEGVEKYIIFATHFSNVRDISEENQKKLYKCSTNNQNIHPTH